MIVDNFLYVLIILYLTLALGIFIKIYLKGVRGFTLFIHPFIMPIIIFDSGIKFAFHEAIKQATPWQKLRVFILLFKAVIIMFPIIVGVSGKHIYDTQLEIAEKMKKRKPKERRLHLREQLSDQNKFTKNFLKQQHHMYCH
ncbi:hypothetical protein SAMN02745885_01674 [Carboxydocella sporoproducens DSM 16521]|uniref:Uncharacterized protein n=2 Tax=Carboxydocella TaxID=178898 RepID=A0A1T4QGV1_9FIRM|nr:MULTISPECIES: hypothetical protein [Carboxydocella]AVX21577.1 hypothetical protein CFE_2434 [Carboxydocella thermautotrophica]AVX31784.1 hypothetical protein CTH_2241 [Carboxydocella thermautotrophica]SKA02949.1 hypothetical protein SAMN02745885_01674 [Carboxydocella sporoproducens DSM 16521]